MSDEPADALPPMRDLGLSYMEAAHGVQTAVAFRMAQPNQIETDPKHTRTGIDLQKAEHYGLARLLIAKGLITWDEYAEYMRLAVNEEVAREEERYAQFNISFR